MALTREQHRKKRHGKIRSTISGTAKRPRLSVRRTLKAMYAQLIDDQAGKVILSASSLKDKAGSTMDAAKKVGEDIAKQAKAKKIETCVFDRSGLPLPWPCESSWLMALDEGGLQVLITNYKLSS